MGYEVRRKSWRPEWRPDLLAGLSSPKTVIDVGTASGTPKLYEAFPDACYLLIEPLVEFEPAIKALLGTDLRGDYYIGAVGAEEQKSVIRVEQEAALGLTKSSMHERVGYSLAGKSFQEREIPISTLDKLASEKDLQGPFVIKIDTEGHELDVLKGAPEVLRETDLVISETCLAQRFSNSYTFAEYVKFMDEMYFDFYGILHASVVKDSHQIIYLDTVFKKRK